MNPIEELIFKTILLNMIIKMFREQNNYNNYYDDNDDNYWDDNSYYNLYQD